MPLTEIQEWEELDYPDVNPYYDEMFGNNTKSKAKDENQGCSGLILVFFLLLFAVYFCR